MRTPGFTALASLGPPSGRYASRTLVHAATDRVMPAGCLGDCYYLCLYAGPFGSAEHDRCVDVCSGAFCPPPPPRTQLARP